jgi:hypothetical protein
MFGSKPKPILWNNLKRDKSTIPVQNIDHNYILQCIYRGALGEPEKYTDYHRNATKQIHTFSPDNIVYHFKSKKFSWVDNLYSYDSTHKYIMIAAGIQFIRGELFLLNLLQNNDDGSWLLNGTPIDQTELQVKINNIIGLDPNTYLFRAMERRISLKLDDSEEYSLSLLQWIHLWLENKIPSKLLLPIAITKNILELVSNIFNEIGYVAGPSDDQLYRPPSPLNIKDKVALNIKNKVALNIKDKVALSIITSGFIRKVSTQVHVMGKNGLLRRIFTPFNISNADYL